MCASISRTGRRAATWRRFTRLPSTRPNAWSAYPSWRLARNRKPAPPDSRLATGSPSASLLLAFCRTTHWQDRDKNTWPRDGLSSRGLVMGSDCLLLTAYCLLLTALRQRFYDDVEAERARLLHP